MTEQKFCELHSGYFGETIDQIEQQVMIKFTGQELFDYVKQLSEQYANEKVKEFGNYLENQSYDDAMTTFKQDVDNFINSTS